eukprot:CAMPEP_0114149832 /NCGR_PEP_ID=MMETSP0043_2-20121206/22376_1 /TAXON_ID=464988 /ORGANISM="Hemiselmis andersenii, Strain CCMP644" /LENGTH=340 /DNA_ID=CAMNT_0001244515 /DNA_START=100 /DNA_END=1122 /DNA_ORIENTATION=+
MAAFSKGLDASRPVAASKFVAGSAVPARKRALAGPPKMAASGTGVVVRTASLRVVASSIAAVATWLLVHSAGCGVVVASSIVGLAAGFGLPTPLATAAFCGSFCGMSSAVVAPGAVEAGVLGAGAGSILSALDATNARFLRGYGGRLGAAATLSALVSIAATPSLRRAGLLYQPELAAAAASTASRPATAIAVLATVLGAAVMRGWARGVPRMQGLLKMEAELLDQLVARTTNPVFSASLIGLMAGLGLGSTRPTLAAAAFAGAFVAMSPPDKLGGFRALLVAAAFAGLAQVGLTGIGVGAGGKLGAAAVLGVFATRQLRAAKKKATETIVRATQTLRRE